MSLTLTIQGTTVNFLEGSFKISEQVDNRSTCSFSLVDVAGSTHYQKGQPVSITDSVLGLLFSGFIHDVTETKLPPNNAVRHDFNCVDNVYLADKRLVNKSYINEYAGDITSDLLSTYLSAEGVTSSYAIDIDKNQTDFAQGTLSNTTATSNIGNGDLELSLAGSTVTITENTTSNFSSGSLNNVVATSNTLVLKSYNGINISANCVGDVGDAHLYFMLNNTNIAQTNDWLLEYTLWVDGTSAEIKAAVDVVYTDGTALRNYGAGVGVVDQRGFGSNPNTDLNGWANNQWYYRRIGLSPFTGKTIHYISFSFESDKAGYFNAYLHDVKLTYGGSTMLDVSGNFGTTIYGWQISNNGYANVQAKTLTVYEKTGTRTSGNYSLSSAGIYQNSLVTWNEAGSDVFNGVDTGNTSFNLQTSIDGGTTWQTATNHSSVSNFIAGANLSGENIILQEILSITGNTPTVTPVLKSITASIFPSYTATKSDVQYRKTTQSDFNAGSLAGLIAEPSGSLSINGYWKDWTDGSTSGQTLFGTSTPYLYIYSNELYLASGTGTDVRTRLDNAGQWQNFIAQVVVQIPTAANGNIGLVYRTSGWQNSNDTYGYCVFFNSTQINFGRGTNTNTGAGSYTSIATATVSLTVSNFYILKIIVNGNSHQIYLDDVLYINATDSTWSSQGYLGLRLYNGTGGNLGGYFGDFSVVSQLTGTYVSENLSLNSVGTAGDSKIFWNDSVPSSGSNVIKTSIDGGTTWQTATNGGQISGITSGTNLSGKNLNVQCTLTTSDVGKQTVLNGYTAWVSSQYTASGTRVSLPLSLNTVGRAGSSIVAWSDNLPSGCSVGVDTSFNGSTWTDVTSSNGGNIPGLAVQPSPTIDTFNSNTSGNYSNTHYGSGTNATWTYDTANSKITATSTNGLDTDNALFLYNSLTYQDGYVEFDTDTADSSGVALQYQSGSQSMYLIKVQDASATSGAPNTVGLYKRSGSTFQLGSNSSISFTRGTVHRFRLDLQTGVLTVLMDGVQIIRYDDTGGPALSGVGQYALRAGKSGNFYSVRMQGYGDQCSGKTVYSRVRLSSTNPLYTPQITNLSLSVHSPDIGNGVLISATSSTQRYVGDVMNDLSSASNYTWTIDKNKKMQFHDRNTNPAPWPVSSKDMLISGTTVMNSADLYRNQQTVIGGTDTASFNKTFLGDGLTQSFTLPYPLASVPTVTVNGYSKTIGVKGIDTGKDFYYAVNDAVVIQDASATPLSPLEILIVSGYGVVPVTITVSNSSGITARQAIEGGSGIVENVEDASSLGLNKAAATQLANALLTRYGTIGRTINFSTRRTGLTIGQYLTVFFPEHGVNDVAFLITKLDTTVRTLGGNIIDYVFTVEAMEGPNLTNWARAIVGK